MNATRRKWKVVFQRKAVTTDLYGGEIETWSDFAIEMADVRFAAGNERRAAAQEGASAAATFIVIANARTRVISVLDRIAFDGSLWDIVSNIPSREFNAGREIEATRAVR